MTRPTAWTPRPQELFILSSSPIVSVTIKGWQSVVQRECSFQWSKQGIFGLLGKLMEICFANKVSTLNRRDFNSLREFVSPSVSGGIFLGGSAYIGSYPDCLEEETCGSERVTWADGSSLDSTLYTGWLRVRINDNRETGVLRVNIKLINVWFSP